MTPHRTCRHAAGVLLAGGLTLGAWTVLAAGAAHAADDTTGMSVTLPAANPTTTPPPTPTPTLSPNPNPNPDAGPANPAGTTTPTTRPRATGTGKAPADDPAPAPTRTCAPTEPAVPDAPANAATQAAVDKDLYLPGQRVTVTATGFVPGEQVQLVLFSDPTLIGSFTADAAGQVQAIFPIADTTRPGTHTVQLTGWCAGVASADLLVGSTTSSAPARQGVPPWAWWAGGGLGVTGAGVGGWFLLRLMRAPAAAMIEVAVP